MPKSQYKAEEKLKGVYIHMRISQAEKYAFQALADLQDEGNISRMIRRLIKQEMHKNGIEVQQ